MSSVAKSGEDWLVVTSTKAALVNLVAAAVTGLERYDRILFLTGTSGATPAGERDIEAQRGFDRLLKALEHEARHRGLNWRPPAPDELTADVNDPSPWVTELGAFFGPDGAGKDASRIVYVYTGGTKDMALGCWEALTTLSERRPELVIELVSKQDRRVFWSKTGHSAQRSVPLAGGANHISLEGLLFAGGYRIVNREACERRRRFALDNADPVAALGDILLGREDARRQQWMRLLNRLSLYEEGDIATVAARHKLPRVDAGAFCTALGTLLRTLSAGTCTLSLANGRGTFRRAEGALQQTFQGDWFEDWLLVRAHRALRDTAATATQGLKIARHDAAGGGQDYEIDLAVLANDQLYIAEAKTGQLDREEAQAAVSRLTVLRSQVVGPSRLGKAWLVCAEPVAETAERREIAAHQDVTVVAGKAEIDAMIASLPALVA